MDMYDPDQSTELGESNIKNIVKTEYTNEVNIQSEHEWLSAADSKQAGRTIDPILSIVKSEYELQSCILDWSVDIAENSDENEEDGEGDVNEYDYDDEKNPLLSESAVYSEASKREQYLFYKKKRNLFEPYLLRDCSYCDITFESVETWDTHLKDVHFSHSDAGEVTCNECKISLCNKDILTGHFLVHLPNMNIFKCKLCSYACSRHKQLLFHIETKHFHALDNAFSALKEINQYASLKCCAYCGKYVGISSMLSTHIQVEHSEIYEHKLFHVCPFCGEQFVKEKLHKEHLRNIHQFESLNGLSLEIIEKQENSSNNMKFRCLKCSELLADSSYTFGLIAHALSHLSYNCYKCRFCEYDNKSKSKVIQHTCKDLLIDIKNNSMQITRTTPSKRFLHRYRDRNLDAKNKLLLVCPKCGENFQQQGLWEVHLTEAHSFHKYEFLNIETTASSDGKSKIISCTICKKVFGRPNCSNIKHHAFTHMPYNLYKCKLCQASMNSVFVCSCKGKYSSFIHVCPKCGKEFNKKCYWNNHMIKTHDLREMSGLNFYKISDTESPNYKCSDCDAVIQESSPSCTDLLFQHATIEHMPFKCYKCSNCGEQSNSNESIIEHCSNCFITTESEVASNTKTKSKINRKRITKDTVDNTGDTKETDGPLHKLLKRSDINKSMIEHNNDGNSTEVNISNESKDTSKTTTRTIISSKIILPLEVKKKTQSDCLEIDKYKVGKLAITSNKYSEYITYACPECNIPFATSKAWHTHISTDHDFFAENRLNITPVPGVTAKAICNECCVTVHGGRYDWHRHKLRHMPYQAFVCNLCMTRSKSQSDLLRHVKCQHFTAGEFKCIFCDLVFKTSYESSKHAKAEHADAEYPENVCHICMKIFSARETLKKHVKRHEFNRELFECGFCERKYLHISILKKHWTDCHPVESALLNRRGKKFVVQKDTRKLRNCIKKILPSQNYLKHYRNFRSVNGKCSSFIRVCPKCGKEFSKKCHWNNHMIKTHDLREMSGLNFYKISDTESPNYKCSDCDAVIQESSSSCTDLLFQHATIEHMPFKCYKCSNCGEQSNSNESIIEHCSNCFITTESEVASNTKTKSKINRKRITKDTVDNTGETKETDGPLHKLLKQSAINKSMIEHSNDGNSTEVNISDESKDTSKTTTRTIISSKIILPLEVKKKTQSDCLEIDKNNVGKLAITSMAICSKKTVVFNKYSEYITYACPECNIPLATSEAWHTHISTEHDFFAENRLNITPVPGVTSKAICNECCVTVHGSRLDLQRHKLRHMPYQAFVCNLCMTRSKSLSDLLRHVKCQHFTAGEFKCLFCDLVFKTSYETSKHTKEEHADAKYPENVCHICMKIFTARETLKKHVKRHEFNRELFECGFCERKYLHISVLKKHWKDCHPFESALLNRRGKKFVVQKDTRKLRNCIKKILPSQNYLKHYRNFRSINGKCSSFIRVCPKCGKEFSKKCHWNNHMIKTHDLREMSALNFYKISDTESPNYKCSDCDAVIQESSSSCTDLLFQHATIEHMPFKCYKCSNCGEQSNSNESIIEHCSNCFITTESEVASNTKTKSKINRKRITKDTVDNTGDTKETDEPLHKLLKQSDINKSMIEHNNDRNSTEVNISDESKDTSKTTTRTIISSKIILPLGDARRRKKKSQSDCLEIDKNNVGKLAITCMAICSKKTVVFNKYSEYITYACPECNIPLATSEAWHTHISKEHDFFAENRLNITPVPGVTAKAICNECCVTVHGGRLHLQRHKLRHMPYRAFICNICLIRSKSLNGLLAHIQCQHFSAGEFKCIFCDLVSKTSYESLKHTKEEHADAEYPKNFCHICMKVLNTRSQDYHMKRHDFNREVFECEFCERKYCRISILKKHWTDCHPVESALLNRRGKRLVVQEDTPKDDSKSKPN